MSYNIIAIFEVENFPEEELKNLESDLGCKGQEVNDITSVFSKELLSINIKEYNKPIYRKVVYEDLSKKEANSIHERLMRLKPKYIIKEEFS